MEEHTTVADMQPPRTPPAWFEMYKRKAEEQEKQIAQLKSLRATDELAWGHLFGKLSDQVSEMFTYIKERLP